MGILYIVSVEESAGKTTICAGLGKYLSGEGKKVGFLKPLSAEKGDADGDVTFMKQVLGLSDVINAPDVLKGRDVVLVESMIGANANAALSQTTYGAAKEMEAKVIAVEAYSGQPSVYIESYHGFGDSLLGVVINKVPQSQIKRVREEATAVFENSGIKLLGVLPEDRILFAITIGELADSIQGKMLNNPEEATGLIENYMLGAMIVDSGLGYFGRKNNKAAIVRQDRPDMQLAALETSTRCLVLSSSEQSPIYSVIEKAENKGIPIISTGMATSDIISRIEDTLSKTRLNQEKKLPRLSDIIKQNMNLQAVF